MPIYFTPPSVAKRYGVGVGKIHELIAAGELEAFDISSRTSKRPRYRISADALERFELRRSAVAKPQQTPKRKPKATRDFFANV
jgi:hypothetical protein